MRTIIFLAGLILGYYMGEYYVLNPNTDYRSCGIPIEVVHTLKDADNKEFVYIKTTKNNLLVSIHKDEGNTKVPYPYACVFKGAK